MYTLHDVAFCHLISLMNTHDDDDDYDDDLCIFLTFSQITRFFSVFFDFSVFLHLSVRYCD